MSIRLSKKHGLAQALGLCPVCHKENGTLLLLGSKADKMGYSGCGDSVITKEICKECIALLDGGAVAFLCTDGRVVVMSKEWKEQVFKKDRWTERIWQITPEDFDNMFAEQLKPTAVEESYEIVKTKEPPPTEQKTKPIKIKKPILKKKVKKSAKKKLVKKPKFKKLSKTCISTHISQECGHTAHEACGGYCHKPYCKVKAHRTIDVTCTCTCHKKRKKK